MEINDNGLILIHTWQRELDMDSEYIDRTSIRIHSWVLAEYYGELVIIIYAKIYYIISNT